jgi:hypothetical protein
LGDVVSKLATSLTSFLCGGVVTLWLFVVVIVVTIVAALVVEVVYEVLGADDLYYIVGWYLVHAVLLV